MFVTMPVRLTLSTISKKILISKCIYRIINNTAEPFERRRKRLKRILMRLVTFKTELTDTTPKVGAWIVDDQIVDLTAIAPDMIQFFEQNCISDARN